MTSKILASAALVVALAVIPTIPARAATVEGFESTTLNSGNSIGDASIRTPSYFTINPTELTHELLLTTISTAGSHDPGPTQSGTNAVSVSALAGFLGVTTASIKDGLVAGQEGSAFQLSLGTLTAGTIISFNYDFLTNDAAPPDGHNDFAFITLTGQSNAVVADELAPPQFATTGAGNPFVLETHYQTFSIIVPTTGVYTLGIGVVDGTTTDNSSALLVDNISVNAVPEPSTIGLIIAGGVSCLAMRRRLKK
jgi:hypothetical protein